MSDFNRNLAFIIGINEYRNGISQLHSATNDAKRLVEILREKHNYQVWVCLDELATLSNLIKLLEDTLSQQVTSEDRLIFYFAGHGIALNGEDGPQGYLIPQDAVLGDTKTYLPMTRLQESLNKLPCRHFLAILDCCFAGAFRWSSTRDLLAPPEVIHQERYNRFIADPAWQVITSAASDQKALDAFSINSERGTVGSHSPFAAALFDALEGDADAYPPLEEGKHRGDGVITATELYMYLRDKVETGTEEYSQRQTPGIWSLSKHNKGEYIFLNPDHPLNLPPAPELDESKNPYRGLQSFEEEHEDLFFGRDALLSRLHEAVQKNPFTVVLGASGSGKSSLMKAGLIPKLKKATIKSTADKWFILPCIRPGELPFRALNNALTSQGLNPVYSQTQDSFSKSISAWATQHPDTKILLFIDQSEEIITLCRDEKQRSAFFECLAQAVNDHWFILKVVLALRSDFEAQLREAGLKFIPAAMKWGKTDFRNNWQIGRFIVPAMTRNELREAIEKPVETRVMYFEPHEMVEELIDEVAGMPGALPLLSFALSELYLKYLRRQRQASIEGRTIDRAITKEDYQAVGSVIQSLTARADEVYNTLKEKNPAYEQVIKYIMLRMVALGGELARRRVPLSELEYPAKTQKLVKDVIERFLDARLLVNGTDSQENAFVEPAHDALVRGWQKLRDWLTVEKNLRLQRRLTPAAIEWKTKKEKKFLWNNDPYLNVLNDVFKSSDNNWLNTVETEFVQKSIRKKESDIATVQGFFLLGLFIAISLAVFQSNQREEAEIKGLALSSEALLAGNYQLDSLVDGIKAETRVQSGFWLQDSTKSQVMSALQQAVYSTKESNRLQGHKSQVRSVRFSPDGNMIASSGDAPAIIIWNKKGELITTLFGHKSRVNNLDFSKDGKILASASWDTTIKLWNLDFDKGKYNNFKTLEGHTDKVYSVSFSPDGKMLASASWDKTIKLWSIPDGKLINTFPVPSEKPNVISFHPNGKIIAASCGDAKIRLWDLNGKLLKTLTGHDKNVIGIRFSHNGQLLASAGFDSKVKIWRVADGKEIASLSGHENKVYSVTFSSDDKTLASAGADNLIKLWSLNNLKDIKEIETLRGHSKDVFSVRFSPDDKTLASASADRSVRLWNLNTSKTISYTQTKASIPAFFPSDNIGNKTENSISQNSNLLTLDLRQEKWVGKITQGIKIKILTAHKDKINSLSFSPEDKVLATASDDNNIILWDLNNEAMKVLTGHDAPINNVIFSPNGKILASAGVDRKVKIWSKSGDLIQTIGDFSSNLFDITFHPNSQIIASADESSNVKLWSLDNYQEIKLPNKIKGYSSTFTPDGKTIATTLDKKIMLWRVTDGTNIGKLSEHEFSVYKISISPDGKILASASADKTIKLWNIQKQKIITTLSGHKDEVRDVSFNHDGQLLVSVSADNTIKVWDVKKQTEITTFKGHSAPILTVGFSHDGKYIASAGEDKKVILWDLDLLNRKNLLKRACESANNFLLATKGDDMDLCDGKMD
ncbi:MAG: caspase family protein [Scytonematopsis contorta HA4267-MV1]|jgi:WD40 repeat protein/energy-coupling factor transporter ATP-binding protein EcfA2|nr:caspase family protein [Scytonematopsis contorta HA4267-MV1]